MSRVDKNIFKKGVVHRKKLGALEGDRSDIESLRQSKGTRPDHGGSLEVGIWHAGKELSRNKAHTSEDKLVIRP